MSKLTAPEREIDGERQRDIAAVISDAGGCKFCIHRAKGLEGAGVFACDTLGRTFPKCRRTPGAKFMQDPTSAAEVEALAHRERSKQNRRAYFVRTLGEDAVREIERKAREARNAVR